MNKKWILINVLLLIVAVSLGRLLMSSVDDYAKVTNKRVKVKPPDIVSNLGPEVYPPRYDPPDFYVIALKNAFSPDRKMGEDQRNPVAAVPPLTQKPILLATFISDTQKRALIIDPTISSQARGSASSRGSSSSIRDLINSLQNATSGRGSRGSSSSSAVVVSSSPTRTTRTPQVNQSVQVKRIGDVYQGYQLTQINPDSIYLESGTSREIIPLHEGTKQLQGMGKTPITATQVVSIGTGSISNSRNSRMPGLPTMGGRNTTPTRNTTRNTTGRNNTRSNTPGGPPSGISDMIQIMGGLADMPMPDPSTMRTLFGDPASGGMPSGNTPFGPMR